MLLYDFQCKNCSHIFEDFVDTAESLPEECPNCCIIGTEYFTKLIGAPLLCTITVPTYPNCKKRKAGYQHHSICAPAEKKGRQISMYGAYKEQK